MSGRLYEIPSDRKKKKKKKKLLKIINYFPCFQNLMINRENLIKKIGRAGDNTTNRETHDQIVRVVMSICSSELDAESDRFEDMIW